MLQHLFLIAIAIAYVVAATSCSKSAAVVGDLNQAIVNGAIEGHDSSLRKQIAKLVMGKAGCTATFIAPHIVLTAAHCLVQSNVFDPLIFVGSDEPSTQFASQATDSRVHPTFLASAHSQEFDLALLWSRDAVSQSSVTLLATTAPVLKQPFTAAGLGLTYYLNAVGSQPGLDRKVRSLTFPYANAGRSSFWFWIEINLNGGLSHGDSGGPLFQNGKQVAVASTIDNDDDGGNVVYTSVVANGPWIQQAIAELTNANLR